MVELVTTENLSKGLLKEIFEAAFMDVSFDDEGDLRVRETVTCWVFPNEEHKDRIRLMALFRFKPETGELERLQVANKINSDYIVVRASSGTNDSLVLTYDILISGGVTQKAVVLALKRFCSIPHEAIGEYGSGHIQ